jgi:hypothetical protein
METDVDALATALMLLNNVNSARNCLTEARDAVYCLLDGLPMHKQIAVADIYCELCCIQGRLEKLLEDVPTVNCVEAGGNGKEE